MRPIDADEVTRDLVFFKYSKEYGEVEEVYNRAVSDCIVDIEVTPTLKNMKPVVHAHWIQAEDECGEGTNVYKCSACREIQFLKFGTPQWNEWNYCPYCGARMDEEEGNDTRTER